jgi:hypothetical protein
VLKFSSSTYASLFNQIEREGLYYFSLTELHRLVILPVTMGILGFLFLPPLLILFVSPLFGKCRINFSHANYVCIRMERASHAGMGTACTFDLFVGSTFLPPVTCWNGIFLGIRSLDKG